MENENTSLQNLTRIIFTPTSAMSLNILHSTSSRVRPQSWYQGDFHSGNLSKVVILAYIIEENIIYYR